MATFESSLQQVLAIMDRFSYILNILIVAILYGAIAIGKDGRIFGNSVEELFDNNEKIETPVETTLEDGTLIIDSRSLAEDVIGFGGLTPLKLYVKNGIIEKVEAQENNETPQFFDQLLINKFLDNWNGLSLFEAVEAEVDVVSGATYSSAAVIQNVRSAAAYGASVEATKVSNLFKKFGLKDLVGILVILSGVYITFFRPKNRLFELIQLGLNVVVLGFWCGSFLSLAQFVSWMSNGFNFVTALLPILLLIVVIIVPLLGKKGSYCHIHCPMGSAQALIGKVRVPKVKIGAKINKYLTKLRYYILLLLLFLMWIGVGFDIMNYELFSAFIAGSASTVVLIMAAIFLVLSLFITKPYCRFICPTGALLTIVQKSK